MNHLTFEIYMGILINLLRMFHLNLIGAETEILRTMDQECTRNRHCKGNLV